PTRRSSPLPHRAAPEATGQEHSQAATQGSPCPQSCPARRTPRCPDGPSHPQPPSTGYPTEAASCATTYPRPTRADPPTQTPPEFPSSPRSTARTATPPDPTA